MTFKVQSPSQSELATDSEYCVLARETVFCQCVQVARETVFGYCVQVTQRQRIGLVAANNSNNDGPTQPPPHGT